MAVIAEVLLLGVKQNAVSFCFHATAVTEPAQLCLQFYIIKEPSATPGLPWVRRCSSKWCSAVKVELWSENKQ